MELTGLHGTKYQLDSKPLVKKRKNFTIDVIWQKEEKKS